MLFDGVQRFDGIQRNELNRFESWFEKFPLAHQKDLRERLRSPDDQNHEGAFFELFLHELLTRLGFLLEIHPDIAGDSDHPDFLVCQDDQRFYLEATMTGQKSGPFTRNPNEQDVIDTLNDLKSPHFRITIHIEGKLSRTLSRKEMVRGFKKLLDGHNPDEVQRLIDEQGRDAAPSHRIEYDNWSLEGWLRPIPPEQRRSNPPRPLILGNHRAARTKAVTPVQNALEKKASKYRNLDAPFVLAVNARDMFYNGQENDMEVLFGDEQLFYPKEHPDLPPQLGRKPNGIWSRKSRIDAFLSFQRVDIWNLWHKVSACLYINPNNTNVALPNALFRLPHTKGYEGAMKWFDGDSIAQLVR